MRPQAKGALTMATPMASDHSMRHPFLIHRVGRFLVWARDEAPGPT